MSTHFVPITLNTSNCYKISDFKETHHGFFMTKKSGVKGLYCDNSGNFVTKKNDVKGLFSDNNGDLVTKRNGFFVSKERNGVLKKTHKLEWMLNKSGCILVSKRKGFVSKSVDEDNEGRGESTMPDRFKYLTKEAPDKPLTWPYFIALGFLLYAWRTVLWELSNWKKATSTLVYCVGYLSKLVLALIFHFIGDPITSLIRSFETMLYAVRAFYSSVINYTPIPEVTMLIILVSTVLAIAEASVPDSVESQPYLLSLAGILGYAAVKGSISSLIFWTLLFGLFSFTRFVKRKDYVSSALPVAALLAGMGEPWVRFVAMTSFLALAITQRVKNVTKDGVDEGDGKGRKLPVPLLVAGLAIGVRVAVKWAGYRHLTWMVV